jgi:ATP-dependent RNA helicase RhlE
MSFETLGLSADLVRAVAEHGYTTPTPIQTQAIPAVLAGGDLMAGAQTGTGKTAGFVLPILQLLASRPGAVTASGRKPVRVLILAPTRELAAQIEESVRVYGKYAKCSSTVVFGGVSINPQMILLKRGIDILVATPGRLLDLQQQRAVDLSHIEILVLDEADRMLDMGFIRDIKRILAFLPKRRQNLLFSATFSAEIKALADGLLNAPAMIEVARRNSTVEIISQKVHPVDRDRKRELLAYLIKKNQWHQVLVFMRTKHGANRLAEQLNKDGITALAIHGNKSQGARTRALAEFKSGSLQVLCATDIAARGIDIDQLPHVVNYELPNVPEDYVHRIGRTGRAGASGEAISLVCVDEHVFLADIERLIKREIEQEVIEGFTPDPHAKAEPILQRQGRGQGQGQGRGQPRQQTRGGGQGQQRSGAAAAGRGKPGGGGHGQGQKQGQAQGQRQGQGAGPGQRAAAKPGQSQGRPNAAAPARPRHPGEAPAKSQHWRDSGSKAQPGRANPQGARPGAPAAAPRSGAPAGGAARKIVYRAGGRPR